jgi:glycosyltransferase involved in cell wall biosynthesis
VSVILPIYNRSGSLRASAASVLSQDFRDLELIIVDDASSEELGPIVRDLADDRVRYVRRDRNGGASRARNTGLALAEGDYIAFQDSDDLWLPGRLRRQVDLLESLPEAVGVVAGLKILYGRDDYHNYGPGKVACAPHPADQLSLEEDQTKRFLLGNRISLQNAVFRRCCFPEGQRFDPCAKANADWEFMARLSKRTKVYEEIVPVSVAFISSDSISRVDRKKLLGLLRILKRNKSTLAIYPDAHAKLLTLISRMMFRIGKPRVARQFLKVAFGIHPQTVIGRSGLGGVLMHRLKRS